MYTVVVSKYMTIPLSYSSFLFPVFYICSVSPSLSPDSLSLSLSLSLFLFTLSPLLPLSPYSLNRLCELPRGFGSFPALEILDLTYNNLTNSSFSANFSYLGECLRCLYMGDNDLTAFPPQIEKFVHLEIVSYVVLAVPAYTSMCISR